MRRVGALVALILVGSALRVTPGRADMAPASPVLLHDAGSIGSSTGSFRDVAVASDPNLYGQPGGEADDDAQMITDARRVMHATVAAYNDKKWDELRALYTDDAVALLPNHDPIQGRDAIIEFLRGFRDVLGPIDDDSFEPVRAKANGKIANFVDRFTTGSGRVRWVADGLYERQPDGSVLFGVDQVGFADAAG